MESPSQDERGDNDQEMAVAQLIQIKYLLAGLLALAVFGRIGDWTTDLITLAVTFMFVSAVETTCAWIPGTAGRLASIHRRRKAAAAESNRKMRKLLRELEEAEQQVRNE